MQQMRIKSYNVKVNLPSSIRLELFFLMAVPTCPTGSKSTGRIHPGNHVNKTYKKFILARLLFLNCVLKMALLSGNHPRSYSHPVFKGLYWPIVIPSLHTDFWQNPQRSGNCVWYHVDLFNTCTCWSDLIHMQWVLTWYYTYSPPHVCGFLQKSVWHRER